MKDLIFVPTEDLIEELRTRNRLFVAAYVNKDEKEGEMIQTRWSDSNSWMELIGLANILKSNIEAEFQKEGG